MRPKLLEHPAPSEHERRLRKAYGAPTAFAAFVKKPVRPTSANPIAARLRVECTPTVACERPPSNNEPSSALTLPAPSCTAKAPSSTLNVTSSPPNLLQPPTFSAKKLPPKAPTKLAKSAPPRRPIVHQATKPPATAKPSSSRGVPVRPSAPKRRPRPTSALPHRPSGGVKAASQTTSPIRDALYPRGDVHDKKQLVPERTKEPKAKVARPATAPSRRPRVIEAKRIKPDAASSDDCCLALYGDGAVSWSLPPISSSIRSNICSVSIWLLRAAVPDTFVSSKRHQAAHLNDDGHFVSWSCCGSTNKSIYGCTATSAAAGSETGSGRLVATLSIGNLAIRIAVDGATVNGDECTAFSLPFDHWCHVVLVVEPQALNVYTDGICVDTVYRRHGVPVADTVAAPTLSIGSAMPSTEGLHGLVSQVRVWGRAMNANDVAALHQADYSTASPPVDPTRLLDVSFSTPDHVYDTAQRATRRSLPFTTSGRVAWRQHALPRPLSPAVVYMADFNSTSGCDASRRDGLPFPTLLEQFRTRGSVFELVLEFAVSADDHHRDMPRRMSGSTLMDRIRDIQNLWATFAPTSVLCNPESWRPYPRPNSFEVLCHIGRSGPPQYICLHSQLESQSMPEIAILQRKLQQLLHTESLRAPYETVVQQTLRRMVTLASSQHAETLVALQPPCSIKRLLKYLDGVGCFLDEADVLTLVDALQHFQTLPRAYRAHPPNLYRANQHVPSRAGVYAFPPSQQLQLQVSGLPGFHVACYSFDVCWQLRETLHSSIQRSDDHALQLSSTTTIASTVETIDLKMVSLHPHVHAMLFLVQTTATTGHKPLVVKWVSVDGAHGPCSNLCAHFCVTAPPIASALALCALRRCKTTFEWQLVALGDALSPSLTLLQSMRALIQAKLALTYTLRIQHATAEHKYVEYARRLEKHLQAQYETLTIARVPALPISATQPGVRILLESSSDPAILLFQQSLQDQTPLPALRQIQEKLRDTIESHGWYMPLRSSPIKQKASPLPSKTAVSTSLLFLDAETSHPISNVQISYEALVGSVLQYKPPIATQLPVSIVVRLQQKAHFVQERRREQAQHALAAALVERVIQVAMARAVQHHVRILRKDQQLVAAIMLLRRAMRRRFWTIQQAILVKVQQWKREAVQLPTHRIVRQYNITSPRLELSSSEKDVLLQGLAIPSFTQNTLATPTRPHVNEDWVDDWRVIAEQLQLKERANHSSSQGLWPLPPVRLQPETMYTFRATHPAYEALTVQCTLYPFRTPRPLPVRLVPKRHPVRFQLQTVEASHLCLRDVPIEIIASASCGARRHVVNTDGRGQASIALLRGAYSVHVLSKLPTRGITSKYVPLQIETDGKETRLVLLPIERHPMPVRCHAVCIDTGHLVEHVCVDISDASGPVAQLAPSGRLPLGPYMARANVPGYFEDAHPVYIPLAASPGTMTILPLFLCPHVRFPDELWIVLQASTSNALVLHADATDGYGVVQTASYLREATQWCECKLLQHAPDEAQVMRITTTPKMQLDVHVRWTQRTYVDSDVHASVRVYGIHGLVQHHTKVVDSFHALAPTGWHACTLASPN
ncbi:hypothetical protein SDRG_07397 [Saprolegnia diclina VS20]|uniref:LamG-like jellyroll fold domain-containing protein n=1 Tax=Saprolegnia diclina (strain VS20) TaxID=1156394 RepID=T0QMW0_SAPDV|nr:hypothetical protein SDRG_07397 [Saprolegnia diclina VS20]EQC35165.1 hypothetical protein SDRG_07397 [Saprolegnia diclina VS20]|eukprot:XP_008611449.1 hypothetical protein SDRG_07397 [Saprolegnia diclina VS20]